MKRKLLFAAMFIAGALGQLRAQTDVTSTYITNPGFEGDYTRFLDINTDRGVEKPKGWSIQWDQSGKGQNGMTYVAESMTQDEKTWNAKFGKAYFARMRWESATLYLRQTMQNLRPGSYTLSFSAATFGTKASSGSASVSVAGQTQNITVGTTDPAEWTDYNINFNVTASTPYATIVFTAARTSDNFKFGLDEFKLTYDGSSYYETILTAAQTLYDNNKDWAENGLTDFETAINDNKNKETVADKNAAIVALETAMQTYKDANSTDVTAKITNPNFDSNISGWTTEGGDGNNFQRQTSTQTNFNGGFLEKWRDANIGRNNQKDFNVYQTLSDLPNGEYTVKAAILAQMQGSKGVFNSNTSGYTGRQHGGPYYIDDEKGVWMYASSGESSSNTWANSFSPTFGEEGGGVYRTATISVSNGSLTIGFKGIGSPEGGSNLGTYANWIGCDNWTLSYFGFDPSTLLAQISSLKTQASDLLSNNDYTNVVGTERTTLTSASTLTPADEKKSTLETAISTIEDAINAFTAAKTNYDLLVAEIAKAKALGIATATADGYAATSESTAATALTSCQNLKVAEYTYVKDTYQYGVALGEWTSTGTNTKAAKFSNEHWSGTTHEYMNQDDTNSQGWNANSWSINFSQDVTLPAGNYVFKVAGRQASGDQVTTSLVVKKGEETLGTVSDFPRSNSSRGINKSGETDFEGENDEFANNGKGYGWEWRYVKFTLSEEATVNVAVNSVATAIHMWVSFGDYTLQTDNEANIALITYNVALASAQTILADETYVNVTGSEKTALQNAIAADGTLDKTKKADIEEATTTLNNAREAFTAAKSAYDTYVAAKAVEYENNLPYASSTKFAAIATAQGAADATSAEDATTKTNAILSAYRLYVESNAMAEGVDGADDKTNLIADPNFVDVTIDGTKAGGWTFDQTGGSAAIKKEGESSYEPFTDGSGSSAQVYFDYYNGGNNNQNIHQVIENLAPGRYILSATGRGHGNFNGNLRVYAGSKSVNIPAIGSTGGTFGAGWNDATVVFDQTTTSNVTIGAKTDNSKAQWWGVTRFRLVKISDAVTPLTISAAGWATLYTPYALDFSGVDGLKAYTATLDESTVTLTEVSDVPANTGVVLKGTAGSYNIPWAVSSETNKGSLTGNASEATASDAFDGYNLYMLALNTSNEAQFTKVTSGSIAAGKAFLKVSTATPVKAFTVVFDNATGIDEVVNGESSNGKWYNLAGQRVSKAQRGIYIVNGKKVLVK